MSPSLAFGGLSLRESVLTAEMSERVLSEKSEREAKWQRAIELWDSPDSLALPRAKLGFSSGVPRRNLEMSK
jgi:hypothetical protein